MTVPATSASSGTRRTMRPVASELISPRPAAARSSSSRLPSQPAKRRSSGGSPEAQRTGAAVGGVSRRGSGASRPAIERTTLRPRSVAASRASLLGSARSWRAALSGSSGISAASARGENRSGSESSMSRPIEAGPAAAMRASSSAIWVRGQGHWPRSARVRSSISTMVAGALLRSRGKIRW